MAIANATVTVNAAFLAEIKEVNQELWHLLAETKRVFVHPAASHRDLTQLVEIVSELRDQLALHFALEEAYGYFDDPLYVAPHLGEKADALRKEHRSLYLEICALAEDVEALHFGSGRRPARQRDIAIRFEAFHKRLQEHESREGELILQAYDDDLGVGD